MRIVQRHGRVDRIGSEHPEIHLGLFFPAANLDEYLKLETTLVRKLKQADAAVGTGKVLPGVEAFPPQDHYDADEIAKEIEDIVNNGGGSAAGSGEEYRRRLSNALDADQSLRKRLTLLPHNIGSGFINPAQQGNVFVFCMRMGSNEQVWFRNVMVDEHWAPLVNSAGEWQVEDDTLKSLIAADPGDRRTARELGDETYASAYEAWRIARESALTEWTKSTDPNNLRPALPKSFIDASRFLVSAANGLTPDRERETIQRLNAVPSTRAKNAMRLVLNSEHESDVEKALSIIGVLDQFGIQPAQPVKPLRQIDESEIRLVAWMAVKGGAGV
jgi:hypothetical protein